MNQRHILFDTDKTALTDDQGNAPQKAACGSPEIVEGFLCRFRLGLGFPDLVVDG